MVVVGEILCCGTVVLEVTRQFSGLFTDLQPQWREKPKDHPHMLKQRNISLDTKNLEFYLQILPRVRSPKSA